MAVSRIAGSGGVDYLTSLSQEPIKVKNPKSEMKVEDFINMMVTQLQYQDPLEPAKNDQLLAQMSQIGQLQSSQTLQDSLKSMVTQNNLGAAGNYIGKVVKGPDTITGEQTFGTVQSVQSFNGEVKLQLENGGEIELSKVSDVLGPEAMIGKFVEGTSGAGKTAFRGVVDSVRTEKGLTTLTLAGGKEVGLADVTSMRRATATDETTTSPAPVADSGTERAPS
jgi:flagellar basal-body rod modification protein FlgD